MKHNSGYNKNRVKNIKRARTMILFIIVAVFVIGGSTLMSVKFSESKQAVQALDVNNETSAKASEINQTTSQNQDASDKINYLPLGQDPVADDVASMEKYLVQQEKGQMPDGADGKKVVYLTFDDGPSETVTPKILDVLKDENVKATFFIVGHALDSSDANKNLVKREANEGNAIGNHTYSHDYKYLFPGSTVNINNFTSDIEKTNQSLKNVLGSDFSTRAIRIPGGHMSWKGMQPLDDWFKSNDYHYIDWNALSRDAEGKTKNADELLEQVKETTKGRQKAIILMHDTYGKEETAKALPQVIEYLKAQGYEFRTMK